MRRPIKSVVFWLTTPVKIKLVVSICLIFGLGWLLFKELPTSKTWTSWTMPLAGQTIALDAGHGGLDGGAVSPSGIIEKDIALSVSLFLRDFLQQAGAIVVMTRETDRDLASDEAKKIAKRKKDDLVKRLEYVKRKNASLLVSIHLNSFPDAKYRGAQTFYYTNHPNNQKFAETVQQELREQLENTSRVAKKVDTVFILKSSEIPSILIEVGFLSNLGETELLANTKYQQKLADAIYRGILRYHANGHVSRTP